MKAKEPIDLDRLREQIEDAMRRERPRHEVEPMLNALLERAPDGGELYVFAHRHLAELWLEEHPWRASLHLRRVLKIGAGTDRTHALLGLCQALLGNFESAVVHYERALELSPGNAWYHHNLGHLLDVALRMPEVALLHLRWAHEAEPAEQEVTASLAHCLARIGELEEAEALALQVVSSHPRNEAHASLLAWIRRGAPGGWLLTNEDRPSRRKRERVRRGEAASSANEGDRHVLKALARGMSAAGVSDLLRARAERLWHDYRAQRPNVRVAKPEVHAAALEYAVSVVHGIHGVTQSALAKRYGVSSTAVASRYTDMRSTLNLELGDPRYLS
jgi:tetratricopeptide (TPR) repeat protein